MSFSDKNNKYTYDEMFEIYIGEINDYLPFRGRLDRERALIKELETLKTENYHLKQSLEFGKSSYASLQERLELVNKANKDTQELVFEYRKKERQKVIAELLEWAKKEDNYHSKFDYGAQEVMHRIRQKLNEMKRE